MYIKVAIWGYSQFRQRRIAKMKRQEIGVEDDNPCFPYTATGPWFLGVSRVDLWGGQVGNSSAKML